MKKIILILLSIALFQYSCTKCESSQNDMYSDNVKASKTSNMIKITGNVGNVKYIGKCTSKSTKQTTSSVTTQKWDESKNEWVSVEITINGEQKSTIEIVTNPLDGGSEAGLESNLKVNEPGQYRFVQSADFHNDEKNELDEDNNIREHEYQYGKKKHNVINISRNDISKEDNNNNAKIILLESKITYK